MFGSMNDKGLAFFFLKVLCPIVFISALIGILQHIRILPIVIRAIGTVLSKINGMGKLESFNAVSSLILGQSENFIAYKDILGKMSRNRMYTMAATAMSTVSMSIVGAYMTMLQPKYVVAALVLNMFSTFIVLSLINPYRVEESEENLQMSNLHEGQSFFEMLGEYILAGFKVAIIVAAMLIGFIALISALNALFATVTGWFGYSISFRDPWLYLLPGRPGDGRAGKRSAAGGQYYGYKLVSNEFVAMMDLQKIASTLSRARKALSLSSGLLRQLLVYRHYRRGDQRSERRTGQRGFSLRSEAGLRLHAGQRPVCFHCGTGSVTGASHLSRAMPGFFIRHSPSGWGLPTGSPADNSPQLQQARFCGSLSTYSATTLIRFARAISTIDFTIMASSGSVRMSRTKQPSILMISACRCFSRS